jgi:hypothetical protein
MVAAVVAATALVVRSQLKAVDALAKTSAKLGLTTEDLSAFHHAARLSGLEVRTFNMALQRMVRRVSEAAQGTGEAQGALKELGLDAQALATAGPAEALRIVADALSRVSNQADRVRLAFKLFDSEGVAMVNMLQSGRASLDRASAEVARFGSAVSAVDAQQFENTNDALTRVREQLRGAGFALARQITPFVEGLAGTFVSMVTDIEWWADNFGGAITWVTGRLGTLLDAVHSLKLGWKSTLLVMAKGHAWLQRQLGEIAYPGLRGKTTQKDWEYGLVVEQLERELRGLLEAGKPSAGIAEIADNFRLAARQNAEAMARQKQVFPEFTPAGIPASQRQRQFQEVDLSRTALQTVGATPAKKQQVFDAKAWAEDVKAHKQRAEMLRLLERGMFGALVT